MNKIKISSLLAAIFAADCVMSNGDVVSVMNTVPDDGPDAVPNEVVRFAWYDPIGQHFVVRVTEQGLSDATVNENVIVMLDYEGEEFASELFKRTPQKIVENWG